MQSHELLREVFQKTSAKQVAADLGLSLSMIYKWAEPDEGDGSGTANPLDRIEALLRSTNEPRPDYLIPATNEIVQEFADLLAVIATAASDNQISPKEAKTIRARWEELK